MRNCKKNKAITCTVISVLTGLLLFPGLLHAELAEGFTVEYAELNYGETGYMLDANIQFQFSKEVLKALEHGVALQIDIEIQVKQSRKWIWDKTLHTEILNYRLEHQPLSGQYLVTELDTGIKHHFQNLPVSLEFIGTIRDYPFLRLDTLQEEKQYTTRVRARLNTESLPTPLRLSTLIASHWQLASPWYKWTLK